MRLTEKRPTTIIDRIDKQGNFIHEEYGECYGYKDQKSLMESPSKLGQLEDIEEELGIDLITLFKALKNGIYTKVWKNYAFGNELTIDMRQKCFSFKEYQCSAKAYFKDYGKTWALTKEELL